MGYVHTSYLSLGHVLPRLLTYKMGSCVLCHSFSHSSKHSQFLPYPYYCLLGEDAGVRSCGTSPELPTYMERLESLTTSAPWCHLSQRDGKSWAVPAFHSLEALVDVFSALCRALPWTCHPSAGFDRNGPVGSKGTEGQPGDYSPMTCAWFCQGMKWEVFLQSVYVNAVEKLQFPWKLGKLQRSSFEFLKLIN